MALLVTAFTTAAAANYASGTIIIGNPSNALLSDDSRTAFANPQPLAGDDFITHYLKMTGLVERIPPNAVVSQLQIKVERRASAAPGVGFQTTDEIVSLVVAGAVQAENQADTATTWTATDSTVAYTFSTIPTVPQMNASDFGMAMAMDCLGDIGGDSWPQIDYVSCEVTYTLPDSRPPPPWRDGGPVAVSVQRDLINMGPRSFPEPGRGPRR